MKILFANKRRNIDILREEYPEGKWIYNSQMNTWDNSNGWHVYRCACLKNRWDGDEDFDLVYYRSDTGERLIGLNQFKKKHRDILNNLINRANTNPKQIELNKKAEEQINQIKKEREISEEKLRQKYGTE